MYGDYFDLHSLHQTIHKIAAEGYLHERAREFLLGMAYDVRKANERKREQRSFGIKVDKVKYRGVRILWPDFLPQLAMLRHYAGYRNTDHRDQACIYLLEDCALTSLLAFDAKVGKECSEMLLHFPSFSHDYLFEFCSVCARKYVAVSSGEKRFQSLPKTLRSMFWFSPEYTAFADKIQKAAEEQGCSQDELQDVSPWPKFQW